MSRLNALADRTAGQAFGLTNYDNLEADVNYLIGSGANIAALDAGNTVTISSSWHKVTVATGNIDNINDALGAIAGQSVILDFQNAQTIRNLTGGGLIKTLTGGSVAIAAGALVHFKYDGANWWAIPLVAGGTTIVTRSTRTSSVSTTGTTFAGGADVLASALSFTADGISDYIATLSGYVGGTNGFGGNIALNLDTADGGWVHRWILDSADTSAEFSGLNLRTIIVAPAAGAHTVNFRAVSASASGTFTVTGGAGGAATARPILATVEKLV